MEVDGGDTFEESRERRRKRSFDTQSPVTPISSFGSSTSSRSSELVGDHEALGGCNSTRTSYVPLSKKRKPAEGHPDFASSNTTD